MLAPEQLAKLDAFVERRFEDAVSFLGKLVRIPTDTPPGDNGPAAESAARLLEALGFKVERHVVPERLARERGMGSVTNLVVRERFGAGPVIALNAHGDVVPPGEGWTHPPYGGEVVDGRCMGAVSRCRSPTSPRMPSRCCPAGAAREARSRAVELHFTTTRIRR